ncbi:MAG: hypothetical protein ABFS46_22770, partial [Myxococcota bacterium]
AGELLPVVETTLASEGTAAVDPRTNSLILIGEPRAIAVTLELLALQDRALQTVVVVAWSAETVWLSASGYSVEWSSDTRALPWGRLRAGPPAATDPEAIGDDVAVLGSRAALRAEAIRAEEGGAFSTTLRILEGERGRITSGRVVPFATRGDGGATTALIETRSGLLVRPRILGNGYVQLDLAAFDGSLEDGGAASFAGASTRIVTTPGETLVVGGIERRGDRSEAEGLAEVRGVSEADSVLLLQVDLE